MNILNIGTEELLSQNNIKVHIFENSEFMFYTMASEMADVIRRNNTLNKPTVMIFPVGPVGQYPYFVDIINRESISMRNTIIINMDEYAESPDKLVDITHPLSFRGFMQREVYSKINEELLPLPENRIFPSIENLDEIPNIIGKMGGVDACFGGIGINGHVAFNEPPEQGDALDDDTAFINSTVRIQKIALHTQIVNSISDLFGAYDQMPRYCITIGMKQILQSRKIRLYCAKQWHSAVVRKAVFEKKSRHFPVTLLRDHPDISIGLPSNIADLHF
ncbi:MAG: 6-phosphogluconolactonase [Bacillota bacterium]